MQEVDLKKYYLPEEVEGYELFIGPEGEYYKVKKINGVNTISHYEWAEIYFESKNKKFTPNTFDALNALIHLYGFVRYAHRSISCNPILDIPNPAYHNVSITKEQVASIYNLVYYNEEYLTQDQEAILDYEVNVLNSMSEKVYLKTIRKK